MMTRLRISLALLLGALIVASGCVYSFTGGGLPRHVRTVAVLAFDNETTQPGLSTDVQLQLRDDLPRGLGVRIADEAVADAIIRGRITGYDESATARPSQEPGGRIGVVQREIRLRFDAEIFDVREDAPIWEGRSLTAIGNYSPDSESAADGLARALQQMVQRIREGAQSQW
jgi:hypothetical protein